MYIKREDYINVAKVFILYGLNINYVANWAINMCDIYLLQIYWKASWACYVVNCVKAQSS